MHRAATTPTVLVIDDEPGNLMVVDAALSPVGFEVVGVRDSAEAERFMALSRPDVVLLDVMLGGENGVDVCRRWRAQPAWDALPIILVTGLDAGGHRMSALAAGADDYVEKPIDVEHLHRLVRRWVATGRHSGPVPSEGDGALALAAAMERAARRR